MLVVEDTGACATTLEIAFSRIVNIEVQVVHSAEEARDLLNGGLEPCAVVTDLQLPGESGMDLIRWLRSRPLQLPIVVISGAIDPRAVETTMALGANAFFSKPFSPAEVRRRLEDLIDAR